MKKAILILLITAFLLASVGCAAGGSSSPLPNIPGSSGDAIGEGYGGYYTAYLDFLWKENEGGYFVYEKEGNPYVDIVIPSTYKGEAVIGIGRHAFGAYSKVRTVVIPDSIKIIETQAFNYCDYLESVVFSSGSKLQEIADYAFYNCKTIKSINIPSSVRRIGYMAFSTCPSISSITVDSKNQSYESVDGIVYTKDHKTLVCYPVGSSATSFGIPDSVEIIGEGAFSDCDNLVEIIIPDSVTEIKKAAFAGCEALESLLIGENSRLALIGESAVRECPSLESIYVPSGVKSIGRYAFYCTNFLKMISFGGTCGEWEAISKGERWDVNTGAYDVVCADGTLSKD